MTPNTSI